MPRTSKPMRNRSLETDMARAAIGTIPGTENLLRAVRDDSKGVPSWRPIRAALGHAFADRGERVWMTTAEFTTWMTEQEILRRRRQKVTGEFEDRPYVAIGLGDASRRALVHGRRTPTKAEALACAHYAARFEAPDVMETETFAAWFEPRFGSSLSVSRWLGIDERTPASWMQGFRLKAGERLPTLPNITIVRALDWIDRMGPICPYGERPRVAFTEISEEDSA